MIQKRYQYLTSQGVKWTPWFNFKRGDSLKGLKLEKWQVRGKLVNEYRIVNKDSKD